jgi:tRNA(adenine34) deaminase
MSDAQQAWHALSLPWRTAFDEAWASWCQGSLGVGAVIADEDDRIVARGHNQFFHSGPGPISSTNMAHAEMNALAQLPVGHGQEYRLYSTFEPCYMCTSALHIYRVDRVLFASADPLWAGMDAWLQAAPWASRREMQRVSLGGALGALGYVLHVSRLADIAPPYVLETHRRDSGPLFELATDAEVVATLGARRGSASAEAALDGVWDHLAGVTA